MVPFLEFLESIDKDKPDFEKMIRGTPKFKDKKMNLNSTLTSLNEEEQAFYDSELKKYRI